LAWWGEGEAAEEGLARVLDHPRFALAARGLAGGMLALAGRDRALDSIFKDTGRYIAAMCAFYLHETEGLTLAGLKALCARTGYLSAGRARALLQFLEHLGFVAAGPAATYRLTDVFLASWAAQHRAALAAATALEPAIGAMLAAEEPAFLRAFGRVHAHGLLSTVDRAAPAPELLRAFMHAHAGTQVVWTLIEEAQDGAFPPLRVGPISHSALARRFGVSRVHIRRMFAQAAAERLVRLEPDRRIVFEHRAREQIRVLYAAQLLWILMSAAQARVEPERPSRMYNCDADPTC
jgi:hypothetical protein